MSSAFQRARLTFVPENGSQQPTSVSATGDQAARNRYYLARLGETVLQPFGAGDVIPVNMPGSIEPLVLRPRYIPGFGKP